MRMMIAPVKEYLLSLQNTIKEGLGSFEPQVAFTIDPWHRQEGGGGRSCVLQEGAVFESAGVNFSHVMGHSMPASATAHRPELAGRQFEALGVSCVIHPRNPYVPTTHMNVRLFVAFKENEAPLWWFGGGFDLTPYYPVEEDVIAWHTSIKTACDPFGEKVYPHYKDWADRYFYLPHRQETRGVGGVFFDDLNTSTWGWDFDRCFAFLRSIGDSFWPTYLPIVEKHHQQSYTERERQFQCYRRGRYVEFNLVYDRGTLFGLQSGGRTESILMSLPRHVQWQYQWSPKPGSPESVLYDRYLTPKDWLKINKKPVDIPA